jgi:DegV family protein with EDD domain
MSRLAVVTDSSVYLEPDVAAELGISVVPLTVTFAGRDHAEPEVDRAEFYRWLRESGEKPTTSQPSPGAFAAAFTAAAADGAEEILCITCASALSGTHQSASVAAGLSPVPVRVVDSGTISGGLLLVVSTVARAVRDGASADDAAGLAESMSGRVWSTFATDSLRLLQAGGRLSDDGPEVEGVPVLAMEGTVRSLGAARSVEDAVRWQAEVILAATAQQPSRVTVGHGDVAPLADALAAAIDGGPGVLGVDRYVVGPVVGAHAGAGNFGASYLAPATP